MNRYMKKQKPEVLSVVSESFAFESMSEVPPEAMRVDYVSSWDGLSDWALLTPPVKGDTWLVFIHGHGSTGDQLYTHADLRSKWLPWFQKAGVGVVSVNLRGNAWMCPAAIHDLHELLQWLRGRHNAGQFIFFSGSMGGTSNLIYATHYPDDCAVVAALGATTDLAAYYAWGVKHGPGIQREIVRALARAYGGTPENKAELYRMHSPLHNTDRLTMPMYLSHGEKDELMPVDQMRTFAAALSGMNNVSYVEVKGGDHDSPCFSPLAMEWLLEMAENLHM